MNIFSRFFVIFILTLSASGLFAGVKSIGMGGFNIAYPNERDNVNPAGLVELPSGLDDGFGVLYQRGRSVVHDNTGGFNGKFNATKNRYWPAGTFGVSKLIRENLAFGIPLKNITGVKARYNKPCGLFGTTRTGVELEILELSPTLSWRINENHNLGIAMDIVLARESYKGFQATLPISIRPRHVTNKGYNYSRGLGVTIGYLCKVTPWCSVAISYSPKAPLARFHKYDGLKPNGKLQVPETLHAGLALRFSPQLVWTFDYTHYKIKDFPTAHNSPFAPFPAGAPNGPGAGWKDIDIYAYGLEYKMKNKPIELRAGMSYVTLPIGRHVTIGTPECSGCVKYNGFLGATWKKNDTLDFSFAVEHGFRNKVKGKNSIPLKGGGGEFDISYEMTLVFLGFSIKM